MDTDKAEIETYKRHKRYFEEAKVIGLSAWRKMHCNGQVDVYRDICLFQARYSFSLELSFMCDTCSEKIRGIWYRCLRCIDMDLCANCYNSGQKPSGHLEWHDIIELRLVKEKFNSLIEPFVLFDLQTNPCFYISRSLNKYSSFVVVYNFCSCLQGFFSFLFQYL